MATRSRALGVDPLGQVAEDLPLGARLADPRPPDLGAEGDATLGGGLGAAVALLVARGRRQQHDDLPRVDEHLGRDHDVLVDAHRGPGEAVGDEGGVGERVEEVAAARVEDLDPPVAGGLDHLLRRQPRRRGRGEAPVLGDGRRRVRVERDAARQRGGVGAHLGAALHPGVAADGHEARPLAPHVAPRQREVDHGPHVVRPEGVLGEAHRPDEDGRVRGGVHRRRSAPCRRGWPRRGAPARRTAGRPAAPRARGTRRCAAR